VPRLPSSRKQSNRVVEKIPSLSIYGLARQFEKDTVQPWYKYNGTTCVLVPGTQVEMDFVTRRMTSAFASFSRKASVGRLQPTTSCQDKKKTHVPLHSPTGATHDLKSDNAMRCHHPQTTRDCNFVMAFSKRHFTLYFIADSLPSCDWRHD
jgi:hypothetical protein